jgi:glycosyltransferase involved in cell wall biosynthesis
VLIEAMASGVPVVGSTCGEIAFLRERGYTNLAGFDLSPENVAICHALGLDFVEQGDALCLAERYLPGSFAADLRHGRARAPAEAEGGGLPGAGAPVLAARTAR